MVIIKFQDGTDWFKANWVFRQLAEDIIATFPEDRALRSTIERAQAYGGLFLDSVDAETAAPTLRAIRKVAEETIEGRILGWRQTKPNDNEGQQMYLNCVTELLDLINKQLGA